MTTPPLPSFSAQASSPLQSASPAPTSTGLLHALEHPLADKRLQILRAVAQVGSISGAARQVGVSYKAAWQALDILSNLAGIDLVQRNMGGVGGGGAQLTPAGQTLLQAANSWQQAREQLHQQLQTSWQQTQTQTQSPSTEQAGGSPQPFMPPASAVPCTAIPPTPTPIPAPLGLSGWGGLGLQTSMRNQWPCVLQALNLEGALALVQLQALHAPAMQVQARITAESAELLALAPGQTLLALAKATAVQVGTGADVEGSYNTWPAHIQRIHPGSAGDEVAVELFSGLQLVGFAPAHCGWKVGHAVCVQLAYSAVVLALAN